MNLLEFELEIFLYSGFALAILGSIATVIGPGVRDPIVRTFNTEVAAIGLSLILLTYNHLLALFTFVATTTIVTLILFRAITRLEEINSIEMDYENSKNNRFKNKNSLENGSVDREDLSIKDDPNDEDSENHDMEVQN